MPQCLLPGFPEGATRIGPVLSVLKKEGRVTYFVGPDNYYSHSESDMGGQRFALATLIANGHVRASQVEATLGIAHRTLMRWGRQLDEQGAGPFFSPRPKRGLAVMTPPAIAECTRLLAVGETIAAVARQAGVKESTLRKAVSRGLVPRPQPADAAANADNTQATTKSDRSRADAQAAGAIGTACTRAGERTAAAVGLIKSASARFEHSRDVCLGGLLAGLPALCANGLLSGLQRHLSLPDGFYSALHVVTILACMALARIRRPEGLRHVPPGEFGKLVGLDRIPEVRTLREKTAWLAANGAPQAWMQDLSRSWMEADPREAGYLYVDGHVRVYHGDAALLPRRYVSRERLCLRGTTDYWVNDALGRPFFVVSQTVTAGLGAALLDTIVPELLASVPSQPVQPELDADPLLHRFVMIFDREGADHHLLCGLWKHRIAAITYRKAVKDRWPENEFVQTEVASPGGGATQMKLASRTTTLSAGGDSLPVLEVRRLTQTGHQTAIITTARLLDSPRIAGRMFTRWCQENFFAYMMEHYDIDGLVQYGSQEIPGTVEVVNPARRTLEKNLREHRRSIEKLHAKLGSAHLRDDGSDIQMRAEWLQDIQKLETDLAELKIQRRNTPKKVPLSELPENQRPRALLPLGKMLTDTIKMIAYRAETSLVALLRPHLAKEEEARALIRELFVSSADLEPDEQNKTLTIRIHRMANPAHDKAIAALLTELNALEFKHPETQARMIYELV
jgi:transposase-like protein